MTEKTREELVEELDGIPPEVSLKLYRLDTGKKDTGVIALKVDFGKDGPPKSAEEATLAQTIGALLSIRFSEIMQEMQGDEIGNDSEVLSSLVSQQQDTSGVKDEIDKTLEDMGITTKPNKEVH